MWNFKGSLWNSTQNILPIHWKMWILSTGEILRALRFKSSKVFLKRPPGDSRSQASAAMVLTHLCLNMIQWNGVCVQLLNCFEQTSAASLTKTYAVTIQRYHKLHTKTIHQNAHFAVYGFKILWEISKVPFEIPHKTLNLYTAKYSFYKELKNGQLMIC